MPEKRVMKPKTLLQKLKDGEWKEFTDEEKADFLDSHAKRVGDILEGYRNLERRSLEKARNRLIGYS